MIGKGRLNTIHNESDSGIDNFRDVTLLTAIHTLFEQLLVNQLYAYLEDVSVRSYRINWAY